MGNTETMSSTTTPMPELQTVRAQSYQKPSTGFTAGNWALYLLFSIVMVVVWTVLFVFLNLIKLKKGGFFDALMAIVGNLRFWVIAVPYILGAVYMFFYSTTLFGSIDTEDEAHYVGLWSVMAPTLVVLAYLLFRVLLVGVAIMDVCKIAECTRNNAARM